MRICLYTGSALPKVGGQELVVDALAREFLAAGHEPIVLAPMPRPPLRPDDALLPYRVIRHPRFYSTRRFVSLYRRFLLAAHRAHRFDVIHCHDVYPTGYLAALAALEMKVPVILTSHGGDIRPGNVRLIKPGMNPRYVQAVQSADALVSIGRFTEDAFRQLVPEPKRLVTIPNGVDLRPFEKPVDRPADLNPRIQPGSYFLFIGRLAKRKGVDVLLNALSQLPASEHFQLIIAGSGDERSGLEQQIRSLKLQDRAQLIGRVTGPTKTWLLQNALATVMPSRGWEAFPLVVLESYAAGRPVIASRIAGLEDLIEPSRTGLLAAEESADEFAAAIGQLLNNKTAADEMGNNARQIALAHGWDAIAQRHLKLYQSVVMG